MKVKELQRDSSINEHCSEIIKRGETPFLLQCYCNFIPSVLVLLVPTFLLSYFSTIILSLCPCPPSTMMFLSDLQIGTLISIWAAISSKIEKWLFSKLLFHFYINWYKLSHLCTLLNLQRYNYKYFKKKQDSEQRPHVAVLTD